MNRLSTEKRAQIIGMMVEGISIRSILCNMKISFLGGAGEVTGSCTLVETGDARFLVDCGMSQGGHDAWEKNLAALAFDLRRLDFVLLTRAHIDHSGLLPHLSGVELRG